MAGNFLYSSPGSGKIISFFLRLATKGFNSALLFTGTPRVGSSILQEMLRGFCLLSCREGFSSRYVNVQGSVVTVFLAIVPRVSGRFQLQCWDCSVNYQLKILLRPYWGRLSLLILVWLLQHFRPRNYSLRKEYCRLSVSTVFELDFGQWIFKQIFYNNCLWLDGFTPSPLRTFKRFILGMLEFLCFTCTLLCITLVNVCLNYAWLLLTACRHLGSNWTGWP